MFTSGSTLKVRKLVLLILLIVVTLLITSILIFHYYLQQYFHLELIAPDTVFFAGESYQLSCTTSSQVKSWTCKPTDIAFISSQGVLTALAPGNVDVTISNGICSSSISITIEEYPPKVEHHELKVTLFNKIQLLEDASRYQWRIDNPNIASITDDGFLYAKSLGLVELTATTDRNIHTFQIEVVDSPAKNCFYSQDPLPIVIHMPSEFKPSVWGLLGRNVTYSTSDPSVAMVEDGIIFPTKPGSCEITISDGRTTYSVPVEVIYEIPKEFLSSSLKSQHAFLYDFTHDLVLYAHGGLNDRISIASLTKLFTGFVASQYLSPDMLVVPGEEIFECPEDGSMAGIEFGVALSVKDLYAGLMLRSGNDCAIVMAVTVGRILAGDSTISFSEALALFMDEVNRQAQEYGLTCSHFVTPDGYDAEGHYSTTQDMIKISSLAYSSPFIQDICSYVSYPVTFANGDSFVWDCFVDMMFKESPFYCPYVNGMKTGSTSNAGRCAITSIVYNETVYLAGTFGCWDGDDRFIDTLIMLNNFVFSPSQSTQN